MKSLLRSTPARYRPHSNPPPPPATHTHRDYNHTLTFPYTHPTNNPKLPLSTPPPPPQQHTYYNRTLICPYTHPTKQPFAATVTWSAWWGPGVGSSSARTPSSRSACRQKTGTVAPAHNHTAVNIWLTCNTPAPTCTQPHCRQHLADLQHTCTHLHTATLPSAPGWPATHLYPPAHNHTAVSTWLTCNTPVPTRTQPHCRQHLNDLQHTCTHLHTTTLPSAPGWPATHLYPPAHSHTSTWLTCSTPVPTCTQPHCRQHLVPSGRISVCCTAQLLCC